MRTGDNFRLLDLQAPRCPRARSSRILIRLHARHAHRADDVRADEDRHAAFQHRGHRRAQERDAALLDHVFVDFRLATAEHGSARLAGRHFGGARARAFEAMQMQQMAAIIDDRDRHVPVVFERVRFGGGGDGLDVVVGQYGFRSHFAFGS